MLPLKSHSSSSHFLGTPDIASMEISSLQSFPEMVIEEPQYQINDAFDLTLDDFDFNLFSSDMYSPCALLVPETRGGLMDPLVEAAPTILGEPMKKRKIERWSDSCSPETHKAQRMVTSSPSSTPQLISFGSLDVCAAGSQEFYGAYEIQDCQKEMKRVGPTSRPDIHTQEHLIAERKRRQKLSQSFIALSALIPGLKKIDKLSILGSAIRYMKQLQERIKKLEEEVTIETAETIMVVNKSRVLADDKLLSLEHYSYDQFEQKLPEIEARVLDKYVLFRVHLEKRKGYMTKILSEMEKLNLSVLNNSVLSFGDSMLEITIITQMGIGFCMNIEDVVKNIRTSCIGLDEAYPRTLFASGNGSCSERHIGLDV